MGYLGSWKTIYLLIHTYLSKNNLVLKCSPNLTKEGTDLQNRPHCGVDNLVLVSSDLALQCVLAQGLSESNSAAIVLELGRRRLQLSSEVRPTLFATT